MTDPKAINKAMTQARLRAVARAIGHTIETAYTDAEELFHLVRKARDEGKLMVHRDWSATGMATDYTARVVRNHVDIDAVVGAIVEVTL